MQDFQLLTEISFAVELQQFILINVPNSQDSLYSCYHRWLLELRMLEQLQGLSDLKVKKSINTFFY